MKKALIFGTGENMFRAYEKLVDNYKILAFLDNDSSKQGNKIANYPIISIKDVNNFVYDFIIVTPSNHQSICRQLLDFGVNRENIILLRDIVDYSQYKNTLTVAFCLQGNLTNYLVAANYIWYTAKFILPDSYSIDVYCASEKSYAHFVFDNSDLVQCVYDYPLKDRDFVDYDMVVELDSYPMILYYDEYILARIAPKTVDYLLSCEKFRILYGQILGKEPFMRNHLTVYQEIKGHTWLQTPDADGFLGISREYKYRLSVENDTILDLPSHGQAWIILCSMPSGRVKDWPRSYWATLRGRLLDVYSDHWILDVIKKESDGYFVICLHGEEKMCQRLNLAQMAILLRESRLMVSVDNPLVRLRYALHGSSSVVLFGPTSEKVGGCSGNINLRGTGCKHWCEDVSEDWKKRCLLGEYPPPCMISITPEWVLDAVEQCLSKG